MTNVAHNPYNRIGLHVSREVEARLIQAAGMYHGSGCWTLFLHWFTFGHDSVAHRLARDTINRVMKK